MAIERPQPTSIGTSSISSAGLKRRLGSSRAPARRTKVRPSPLRPVLPRCRRTLALTNAGSKSITSPCTDGCNASPRWSSRRLGRAGTVSVIAGSSTTPTSASHVCGGTCAELSTNTATPVHRTPRSLNATVPRGYGRSPAGLPMGRQDRQDQSEQLRRLLRENPHVQRSAAPAAHTRHATRGAGRHDCLERRGRPAR